MYGWTGRIILVDLTAGTVNTEALNEKFASEYIGRRGLASKYYYEECGCETKPFSDENCVVLMTGPLTGAYGISTGHYSAVAGAPLSGGGYEPSAGGHFGPELKYAGYDGIIFRGSSKSPVCLNISSEGAKLVSAGGLWGLPAPEVSEILINRIGPGTRTCCIGPAGEEKNPLACLVSDGVRTAGTGGVGAVLGAKKLKGIAVRGSGAVKLAEPERYVELVNRCRKYISASPKGFYTGTGPIARLRELGFNSETCRHVACFSCSLGCRYEVRAAEGPNAGTYECPPVEITDIYSRDCGMTDPHSVLLAYNLCLQHGIEPLACAEAVSAAVKGGEDPASLVKKIYGGLPPAAPKPGEPIPARLFAEAAGICELCSGLVPPADAAQMFALATGLNFSVEDAADAGKRIQALENKIMGISRAV